MRILFSSYAYPNAGQPQLATFNRTMIGALSQHHPVRIVAPVPFLQAWRRSPCPANFRVLPDVEATYPTYVYLPRWRPERLHRWLDWSIRPHLDRVFDEFRPDVILSYWTHPDGTVAVETARRHGLPSVVMVGGSDVLVLGRKEPRRSIILQTLQRADRVIAVSQELASTLVSDGIPGDRIEVIGRGIDPAIFSPGDRRTARSALGLDPDRVIILGAGRLVGVKDWPLFLKTCEVLRRRGTPIACYVVGDGPLRAGLEQQARELGLADCVTLVGSQDQQRLSQWYRAADVTLLTSLSEGIPNVLLETIASGGSFVATSVGGIPEIADPLCDRLVASRRPEDLADAILDRLAHPANAEDRVFRPGSPRHVADRITRVLEDACGRHPSFVAPRQTDRTHAGVRS